MTQPLLFLVHGRPSPGIRTDLGHFFCHWMVSIMTVLPCYKGQTELLQVTAVKLSFWYHFLYIPPWSELGIMITEAREAFVRFAQNATGVILTQQNDQIDICIPSPFLSFRQYPLLGGRFHTSN